jgi:hypothetical protein
VARSCSWSTTRPTGSAPASSPGWRSPGQFLVDLDRGAYRAWGLGRASLRQIWLSPATWARYARLLAGGERLRPLGRDTLQLGGDFVVDPDGHVAYARPQRRDDRPPVGELLEALERAGRGGP